MFGLCPKEKELEIIKNHGYTERKSWRLKEAPLDAACCLEEFCIFILLLLKEVDEDTRRAVPIGWKGRMNQNETFQRYN